MKISIAEALGTAVLGLGVVFLVLALLMGVIIVMAAVFKAAGKRKAAPEDESRLLQADKPPARGSCGRVSIFDVPDRTAAMIMAIVADELNAPLNELRFISIKEAE